MRYFITFSSYGAHIHGDEAGSVDSSHNLFGARFLAADEQRASTERRKMTESPFSLDMEQRMAVLETLHEVCIHRGWTLLAANVRTNHVHVVVESAVQPEKVMNDFKAYASRRLNRLGDKERRTRWARHGSTRWLWTDQDVRDAIRYVVEEQGEAMAMFVAGVL